MRFGALLPLVMTAPAFLAVGCTPRLPNVVPSSDFTIRNSRLEGTVLDAETHKPMAGVMLTLVAPGDAEDRGRPRLTQTGGHFTFGWVPNGIYLLTSEQRKTSQKAKGGELRVGFTGTPFRNNRIDDVYCATEGGAAMEGPLIIYIKHRPGWVSSWRLEGATEASPGTHVFRREKLERLPIRRSVGGIE